MRKFIVVFGSAFFFSPLIAKSKKAASKDPNTLLRKAFEQCSHWAGEVDSDMPEQRIKEINNGLAEDCKAALVLVKKHLRSKNNNPTTAGLAIRIIDLCEVSNPEAKNIKKKSNAWCHESQPYFATISSVDEPDAQDAFSSFCPDIAKESKK
jgi:isopentenyl diphosphate isomerase/L-lactate dehydrogenase-like FMN-dependent dehydrogenase